MRKLLATILIITIFFLPAVNAVQTLIPVTGFTQIGTTQLNPGANGAITTSYQRNRAYTSQQYPNVQTVTVNFTISGPSAIQAPDSDGYIRQGITIWPNFQDSCNQYFLAWRTDSSKPAGTTILGAHLVYNPGMNQLSQCPATGFTPLVKQDGTSAFSTLNTNIMDGSSHQLKIVRVSQWGFQLFTDGTLQFTANDPAMILGDIGLYGLRTDNVVASLTYQLGISPSTPIVIDMTYLSIVAGGATGIIALGLLGVAVGVRGRPGK